MEKNNNNSNLEPFLFSSDYAKSAREIEELFGKMRSGREVIREISRSTRWMLKSHLYEENGIQKILDRTESYLFDYVSSIEFPNELRAILISSGIYYVTLIIESYGFEITEKDMSGDGLLDRTSN